MGAIAARKALRVLHHTQQVIGIELLCAAQALDFRRPLRPAPGTQRAHDAVRAAVPPLTTDRVLAPDLAAAILLVQRRTVVRAVEQALGALA
jgi:histidine ammonia-lyase